MKITIKEANNGFIYEVEDESGVITTEVCENDIYTVSGLKKVFEAMICDFCPGSRHDDNRLYAVIAPGDKNPNYTEYHDKILKR